LVFTPPKRIEIIGLLIISLSIYLNVISETRREHTNYAYLDINIAFVLVGE